MPYRWTVTGMLYFESPIGVNAIERPLLAKELELNFGDRGREG
jgi:hypothetical protein